MHVYCMVSEPSLNVSHVSMHAVSLVSMTTCYCMHTCHLGAFIITALISFMFSTAINIVHDLIAQILARPLHRGVDSHIAVQHITQQPM